MASLLGSLFRRSPPSSPPIVLPFTATSNPYRAKRTWPPDFNQLSPKHKFRLERRYRRRTKLKWARPNWTKGVKLAQWGSILFVLVYGLGYLEVGKEGPDGKKKATVMDEIRRWMSEQVGSMEGPRRGGATVGNGREGVVSKG